MKKVREYLKKEIVEEIETKGYAIINSYTSSIKYRINKDNLDETYDGRLMVLDIN